MYEIKLHGLRSLKVMIINALGDLKNSLDMFIGQAKTIALLDALAFIR
jgi:hypothetical protein